MQATTRNVGSIAGCVRRLARGAGLLGFGAVVFLALGVSPARAGGNHFERGFESELGRLAARSIVQIGHSVFLSTSNLSYGSHGVVHRTPHSSFHYVQRPIVIQRYSDHHRLPHHRRAYRFGHVSSGHGHGKHFDLGRGHGRHHRHGPGCRH